MRADYKARWEYLYSGHNLGRASRWKLIAWEDVQAGDVISFVDADGRFCSRTVARRTSHTITAAEQTFAGYKVSPEVLVIHLTRTQIKRGQGKNAAYFRYAERQIPHRPKQRRRRFTPLTLP